MTRKLASIQQIAEIRPIEGADAIEHYRVNGWWVVDKKGAHQVGSKVIYCELDCWIPHEIAPFLSKGQEPKTYEGVVGNRLRTVRLRGALSQGLLLPTITPPLVEDQRMGVLQYDFSASDVGADVTELLGIVKWEPQLPAQLAGKVRGVFPGWMRKTDQERCCSGNTLVQTENGERSIKDLCESKFDGKVWSINHSTGEKELKNVVGWSIMTKKKNAWVKITTKSGKTLIVTNNHKIYLPELDAYREAGAIVPGTKVLILD